jgi:hypothetical protein
MSQTIRISCTGASHADPADLIPFQGDLKELSKENYERLRKQIIELGFSEPVSVWKNQGKLYILNGHQRTRAVLKMREEGFAVATLPINFVEAENEQEAKYKILALTSQFGTITEEGLYEMTSYLGLSSEEIASNFTFAGFEMPKFLESYYGEGGGDDGDMSAGQIPETPKGLESSSNQVRMVQLFFDAKGHEEFLEKTEELAALYETDNITDTVLRAIRETHTLRVTEALRLKEKQREAH